MNEKITLQRLAEQLAGRHQMEQADAEAFVETFVALIGEALQQEKYVKVKGLGTFKLIGVDARESIDVNTGERIEISGHNRVSFVPEASLRDLINKPFSHFETVVLNENTHFDDMTEEVLNENTPSDTEEQPEQPEPEPSKPEPSESEQSEPEPVPAADVTEQSAVSLEEEHTDPEESETILPEGRRLFRIPWCMIATVLFAGVLIGGGVVWALLSGRRYIPEALVHYWMEEHRVEDSLERVAQPVKDTIALQADTSAMVVADTLKAMQPKQQKTVAVPVRRETLADTVDYTIRGTQTSHTIQKGESLAKISLKYYGTKKLWPYLVRHNKETIKDPNNVPIGTVIQIPELVPVQE